MKLFPIMTVLGLCAVTTTAQAQELGDARRGLAYVGRSCSECHAVLPSQSASPVVRAPTFESVANTPGMTATALVVWFRTPHPTMPNLIIQGQDKDDVIAYILGLREKN